MTPWVLTRLHVSLTTTSATIVAATNTIDHLFMMWNYFPPIRKPIYKTVRGKRLLCGYKYAWANPHIAEQIESGNTIEHTFYIDNLTPRATIWFYVWAPLPKRYKNIQGPLMNFTLPFAPPPEPIFEREIHNSSIGLSWKDTSYCYIACSLSLESAAYLTSITIWTYREYGELPVTARMQIRADDDGQPSNSVIELSPTIVTRVGSPRISHKFDFPEMTLLDPDTPYWFVLYRTDSTEYHVFCDCEYPSETPSWHSSHGLQPWNPTTIYLTTLIEGTRPPDLHPYDLEIGSPAIDQIYYWPAGDTVIDSQPLRDPEGNPPTHGGTIDKVYIFATEPLTGVRVGTFARNGNEFTSRDYAVIGDVAGGSKQHFTGLNIVVEPGDCLGIYYASGDFDVGRTADTSIFYKAGNQFGTGPQIYTEFTPWAASLYGYGWTFP